MGHIWIYETINNSYSKSSKETHLIRKYKKNITAPGGYTNETQEILKFDLKKKNAAFCSHLSAGHRRPWSCPR